MAVMDSECYGLVDNNRLCQMEHLRTLWCLSYLENSDREHIPSCPERALTRFKRMRVTGVFHMYGIRRTGLSAAFLSPSR